MCVLLPRSSLFPPALDSSKNNNGTGQEEEQQQSQFEEYVGKNKPIDGWKLVFSVTPCWWRWGCGDAGEMDGNRRRGGHARLTFWSQRMNKDHLIL